MLLRMWRALSTLFLLQSLVRLTAQLLREPDPDLARLAPAPSRETVSDARWVIGIFRANPRRFVSFFSAFFVGVAFPTLYFCNKISTVPCKMLRC